MIYNVAGLLKAHTGASREVALEAWPALGEPDVVLQEPLAGLLTLTRDHAGILVTGRPATKVQVPCVRCLSPAVAEVVVEVEEHFRPTVPVPGDPPVLPDPDGDPATEIDVHHHLDLEEVLRQAMLVAVPLHPLCRPDCHGLCAQCGQDLNDGACDCVSEPDIRWHGLRALLDENHR